MKAIIQRTSEKDNCHINFAGVFNGDKKFTEKAKDLTGNKINAILFLIVKEEPVWLFFALFLLSL